MLMKNSMMVLHEAHQKMLLKIVLPQGMTVPEGLCLLKRLMMELVAAK